MDEIKRYLEESYLNFHHKQVNVRVPVKRVLFATQLPSRWST